MTLCCREKSRRKGRCGKRLAGWSGRSIRDKRLSGGESVSAMPETKRTAALPKRRRGSPRGAVPVQTAATGASGFPGPQHVRSEAAQEPLGENWTQAMRLGPTQAPPARFPRDAREIETRAALLDLDRGKAVAREPLDHEQARRAAVPQTRGYVAVRRAARVAANVHACLPNRPHHLPGLRAQPSAALSRDAAQFEEPGCASHKSCIQE